MVSNYNEIILSHFFKLLFLISLFSCQAQDTIQRTSKMNGMSMVSINETIDSTAILPLLNINANWVSIIPFAFMTSPNSPNLSFNAKDQWKGERIDGVKESIRLMQDYELKVMLKPQIWVGHGSFTGNVGMNSEEDWLTFQKEYRNYIMAFVSVAIEYDVEMICLGTELKRFAVKRPKFWSQLIKDIRLIYSGNLTYAANWDCYMDIPFWKELDFIGIDAYFPISNVESPTLDVLKNGWKPYQKQIDSVSVVHNKKIIFTEYGYRSIKTCAIKPWSYSTKGIVDQEAQKNALKVLYNVFWNENNFAGGFLWKWYPNHDIAGGEKDNNFTVQNKSAEKLVKSVYKL